MFAILLACVHGRAYVEDHSAEWAAAGLTGYPLRRVSNALNRELFEAVDKTLLRLPPEEATYKDGKKTTFWFPREQWIHPRNAIELAVTELFRIDFADGAARVIGAEWWTQDRDPHVDIGFHYDKDESFASNQQMVKYPPVSTILYITDHGAATCVFNQTYDAYGNDIPELPELAWFSSPK